MDKAETMAGLVSGGIALALGLMLLGGALDDATLTLPGQVLAAVLVPVGAVIARPRR